MPFFDHINNYIIESKSNSWIIKLFGLNGLANPFLANERPVQDVSGLVGSVLTVTQRKYVLMKGGLIRPLIKKLFCGSSYVSLLSQKKLKHHWFVIVARLRILHKCPLKPLYSTVVEYHSFPVVCDFSVDSRTGNVAVVRETSLDVWSPTGERRIANSKTTHSSHSNRVAFGGGDGTNSTLAVCSGNEVSLYEEAPIVSGTQKITSGATVTTVQFSPDGRVLIIGLSNKTVLVLKKRRSADRTEQWVCVETLPAQTGEITSVAFYHRSEILTLGIALDDNTIKLWEISSDETKPSCCVDTLVGHSSWVTSLSFDQRFGMLASGSNDKTVKVWMRIDGKYQCKLTLANYRITVSSVAFSQNGFFLASSGSMGKSTNNECEIWRIFMSSTSVNAELVLKQYVEYGIDQLKFCPKTGNLLIGTINGLFRLE